VSINVLAFAAASWGVVMALSPMLQVRRMLRRKSSADVSIGYLAVLLPGFILWVAYGIASRDVALVIPNALAALIAGAAIAVAVSLRTPAKPGPRTPVER
jgi:MtN3 and saliva related transmembrane protein